MSDKGNQYDLLGRLMFLEQQVKGLRSRLHALEISITASRAGPEGRLVRADPEDEFMPAAPYAHEDVIASYEDRIRALEVSLEPAGKEPKSAASGKLSVDGAGLIIGILLTLAGVLLLTGNLDLLRNPMLSLGCGIIVSAYALLRPYYR